MGLFSHTEVLLHANILDLVNKAEAPEKLLNLYIERVAEESRNLVTQANRAIFDKTQLVERIKKLRVEIAMRAKLASLAEKEGEDDLARTALDLKKQAETSMADCEVQLIDQIQTLEALYENLRILIEKIGKAEQVRNNFVIRQHWEETKPPMYCYIAK
ncbi:phage shock protein A (IM30), suppresses sigma54-dependent transcription [Desulfitobacterium dichloroeliminans LMG P-21439]|uniref:Phage shock protein A (IM30), suppresses sigma54-dependent transcription n=1 Tax=Desulfitobacterium dichloroeliminans (strain LMG P-21439 / DCA1) TaxID=871963 RepID=L0F7P4_DESDL|nr:PspA/IM30 family protein [Desulfitobacterium dichloroeliminans]AGA68671.1 phage shock protein A (IM30), suppresses sigma54-dependent transcription [Desulfitobacterium dichloroeliminans LMG P-21439]